MQPFSDTHEPDGPDEQRIVDPEVISERRARRTELSEDALREHAAAVEDELGQAHAQLRAARDQRAELAGQLKQAERDLRAARQGEHAEAARRSELEEDAAAARREAEATIGSLRAALGAREQRVAELAEDLSRRVGREAPPRPAGGAHAAAEVAELQRELDRRAAVHETVSRQLVELRAALEATRAELSTDSERKAVAAAVLADLGSTAVKLRDQLKVLEAERRALEEQLATARGQLTTERAARLDAEAALAERRSVESEIAGAVSALRSELAQVRAESDARAAREEQLQELVGELVGTAGALTEGFEREIAALKSEQDEELAAQRARFSEQLAGMEARMVELRDQLAAATNAMATQLEAQAQVERERAVREAAAQDPALSGEGAEHAELIRLGAELLRREAEGARAEVRILELEDELERARIALRPPAPMPPADHPALSGGAPAGEAAPAEADSVIIDLARAAARLRTRRADEEDELDGEVSDDELVDVDAEADHGDHDAGPPPATVDEPADEAPEAVVADASPAVEIGPRIGEAARPADAPWVTAAIGAVARRDPQAAATIIAALIPLQAARLARDLTYDLAIAGHPELRVTLHADGTAAVAPRGPEDGARGASFRLVGSPVALAPYVGGGTGRGTPEGVVVSGRRRRARRLRKALREPVTLPALEELGPQALLTLVATAIDPTLTREDRFTIAFADGDAAPSAHIVVAAGMPLAARVGAPIHAAATVRTGADGLAAFLGGTGSARVTGDVEAVTRLLGWADSGQGLRA